MPFIVVFQTNDHDVANEGFGLLTTLGDSAVANSEGDFTVSLSQTLETADSN